MNTTTQVVSDTDPLVRPGQVGDNEILVNDFTVTDFGGFGQDLVIAEGGPQDWSLTDGFSFWFYGTGSGLTYQAEISDNRSDPNIDTSERFDYEFTDTTSGWQRISIPWSDFTRATDFQPSGAPNDGLTLTEVWAWAIVLPQGIDTVYFDDFGVDNHVIDDFDDLAPGALPSGIDAGSGVPIGFFTFSDGSSPVEIANEATPPLSFEYGAPNSAIAATMNVGSFAGFIHNFANESLDVWTPQDWSAYQGFAFWLYGQNTGTDLFVDLIENRNPGSTTDDAERWSVALVDDFSGWRYFEYRFDDFFRKDIGNGAPNDGFTRQEMHGWAFGALSTGGNEYTWYLDGVSLFGSAADIPLTVAFSEGIFDIEEGTTGTVIVKLNRPMVEGDPASVSVDYATEPAIAIPGRDYTPVAGSLTFVQGGPQEQSFSIETFDNSKFEGAKRIVLRLSNPADVELGFIRQASALIQDNDPFDPNLIDDFERGAFLWQADDDIVLETPEIAVGDLMAVPGQDAYEQILSASTPIAVDTVIAGNLCIKGNGVVPVAILTTDYFDATTVDHATVRFGDAAEAHGNKKNVQRHEEDFDGDGDIDLVFHFRLKETGYDCDTTDTVLTGATFSGQAIGAGGNPAFGRDFALGRDWTRGEALRFWFYGTGSGDEIGVTLKDNRAPDPGPDGWVQVWSDEFNEPAGSPPNPENWTHEIGDVTPDGKNGWGNEERQYYTDDPANAATDGNGNLVITLREADGSLECYYGTCEYTSARLLSWHKTEFTYGRIESRLRVPTGEAGLWPAFWSLGTDIDRNPWPGAGEIDFMEYVSRLPNEIFGTIHGPGYSGGASFGNLYDFGEPVFNDFHTFVVEWEPNEIRWYVDDILYHTATPGDVPGPWVFDKPFFMLLNFAIGGNFGGTISPNLVTPQEYLIDYVRLYQAPDTAERFEASFVDNFTGWQEVVIPLAAFSRSDDQPPGAPDDGLALSDVWGYGFTLPDGGTTGGTLLLDQVRLQLLPPPTEITVTNLNDGGNGSLRQALEDIAIGGTITFDSSLAGGTIALATGPLVPKGDVTIDASDASGLTLDGGATDRVLIVDAGLSVNVSYLTVTNGFGFQLAGGILNNGDLTLDHVTVSGNLMTTDGGDFWQGGGGIYNGGGSTLNLIDSTVADNNSGWAGGGVYSFFGTNIFVERSTISGNTAQDVGGGLRTLGNATIVNSTVSGNTSTAWHGGGAFITDGVVDIVNSTVTDNNAPPETAGGLFTGTFTDASATLNLQNTIVAGNANFGCFLAPFGAGAVAINSLGNSVYSDTTCNPTGSDLIVGDAGLGPLANNGGPTQTHALLAGSLAIDAADGTVCPATDQRGVARPQGAGCDVGAFEVELP